MKMKTFIITLSSNEESVKSAERTRQSAKNVGYNEPIEKFEAVLPTEWQTVLLGGMENEHNAYFQRYKRPDNVAACFASHYLLWKKCVELNEPILILEHDAIFKDNIPDIDFKMCINLGRPSYIQPHQVVYEEPSYGVHKLVQKNFLGHHAYAIKPEAAQILCQDAESRHLDANDIFVNSDRYFWLEDYNPHPIWADTQFSTIQDVWMDPNISWLDNYKNIFPGLSVWKEDSPEFEYLLRHYSHCLTEPQSATYIDAVTGSLLS